MDLTFELQNTRKVGKYQIYLNLYVYQKTSSIKTKLIKKNSLTRPWVSKQDYSEMASAQLNYTKTTNTTKSLEQQNLRYTIISPKIIMQMNCKIANQSIERFREGVHAKDLRRP